MKRSLEAMSRKEAMQELPELLESLATSLHGATKLFDMSEHFYVEGLHMRIGQAARVLGALTDQPAADWLADITATEEH